MRFGTPYHRHRFDDARYDTIVIGSGMGGLTTAALLAKHGHERVLVLERHYTAGGLTQTFSRPGFEWDVGLHYIGEVSEPGMIMRRIYDHLSEGRIAWADMGEVYDTFVIAGRRYDYVKGKEGFRRRMKEYFPADAAAIDRYLALISKIAFRRKLFFAEKVLSGPLRTLLGGPLRWPALRFARATTEEVLAELTDNLELRAVLAAQWGNTGLPPSQGSFLMHAIAFNHYLNGAAYPVGGSDRIAETLLPVIEAAGGAVLVRAEVREILLEAGRAVGVRMDDGRELRAAKVVSSAGVAITYGRLLSEEARSRYDLKLPPEITPSIAHLGLYVGLDRSDAELGLTKANRWLFSSRNYAADLAAFIDDPEAPLPAVYLSFPSAKDPDFARRHPGRATVQVIAPGPYAWFQEWEERAWGKRGDAYDAFKARLTERLVAALERECPSVVGHIVHAELSTALSTRHFTGRPQGEPYGLSHNPARFMHRELRPRTPVPGLYLTGADVLCAGVSAAMVGGILCASVLLRRNLISAILRPAPSRPGQTQAPLTGALDLTSRP